jgi:hypothetical protein
MSQARALCVLVATAALLLVSRGLAGDQGAAGSAAAACDSPDRCSIEIAGPEEGTAVPPEPPMPGKLLFFWAKGCSHCERAGEYLERLRDRHPTLQIESVEVRDDPVGRRRFFGTMAARGVVTPGIPAFVIGDSLEIGFVEGVTEDAIERHLGAPRQGPVVSGEERPEGVQTEHFGWIDASKLGLPLFTIALGLLDGFNPCAMWVLIFLLATLAGQGDRTRMAVTAVTFVAVSGLMYFAFMAAWLGVFLAVGITRPVQLVLGAVALGMGSVNLKDFFSFGRGPSLAIPDQAKPGIYARVRKLLREHSLLASLASVTVLAVLVNCVELLCTAGLPAVYTAVLAGRGLSMLARFAYLALYNVAYVLDDSIMVAIAVVTLNRQKLTETGGRWLKLVSGSVMIVLSALLILRPEWLP